MKKNPTASEKNKVVSSLVSKYKELMNLSDWRIDYNIYYEHPDDMAAECNVCLTYLKAKINLYNNAFADHDYLEHVIKHEMSHILTEQLVIFCYDLLNAKLVTHHQIEMERERLTERIARLI